MFRTLLAAGLLLLPAASAAPVPVPDPTKDRDGLPLPKGAIARLGSLIGSSPSGVAVFSADGKHLVVVDPTFRLILDAGASRPLAYTQISPTEANGRFTTPHAAPGDISAVRVLTRERAERNQFRVISTFAATGKVANELLFEADSTDNVVGLADGKSFAIVGPKRIELRDLDTGRRTHSLSNDARVPQLLGTTSDRTKLYARDLLAPRVLRWDLTTQKELPPLALPGRETRHAVSGDGNWLAAGREVENAKEKPEKPATSRLEIDVFDLRTDKVARTLHFDRTAQVLAVGEDGLLVDGPKSVARYSLATGKKEWEFETPQPSPQLLAAHESRVAVRSPWGRLDILDAKTGRPVAEPPIPDTAVFNPRFSVDGTSVYSTTSAGRLRQWTSAGKPVPLTTPWADRRVSFVRSSADRVIESSLDPADDGAVKFTVWELAGKEPLSTYTAAKGSTLRAVTSDQRIVIERPSDGKMTVVVANPTTGKVSSEWERSPNAKWQAGPLVLSSDGTTAVVRERGPKGQAFGAVVGLSVTDGTERFRIPAEKTAALPPYNATAVSHDAGFVAFAGTGGVSVLDVKAETVTSHMKGRGVSQVRFDPTGTRLVGWNFAPTGAVVVDLKAEGGAREYPLDYSRGTPTSGDISPDGKRAVVGYSDGTALIWDLTAK